MENVNVHANQYKKLLNTVWNCGNIERYMNKFMKEALTEAQKAFERVHGHIGPYIVKD